MISNITHRALSRVNVKSKDLFLNFRYFSSHGDPFVSSVLFSHVYFSFFFVLSFFLLLFSLISLLSFSFGFLSSVFLSSFFYFPSFSFSCSRMDGTISCIVFPIEVVLNQYRVMQGQKRTNVIEIKNVKEHTRTLISLGMNNNLCKFEITYNYMSDLQIK